MHTDPYGTHAWFAQIRGTKRFLLYPPSVIRAIAGAEAGFSPVPQPLPAPPSAAVARPGDAQQPSSINALTCVPCAAVDVADGDILFIPANWPHAVEALTPSISLTHNFIDKRGFNTLRALFLQQAAGRVAVGGGFVADSVVQ